jgi:hypothetical protein
MTVGQTARDAFAIAAAILALPSCGLPQIASPDSQSQRLPATSVVRRTSWMSPDAKAIDLIYVLGSTNSSEPAIYVYSYPKGKLEGTIVDGLDRPSAECVDKAGDVFVPNYDSSKILEYPHGATTPSVTYDDYPFAPYGCAVDPVTGELAVANLTNFSAGNGDIAFFKPPHLKSRLHISDVKITEMEACAYDVKGDLYLYGLNYSTWEFGMLRAGRHYIIGLGLSPKPTYPGNIYWDDTDLVIADGGKGEIIRYAISGQTGTKVGSTTLKDNSQIQYFWIAHPNVLAPLFRQPDIGFYKYPAGGSPFKVITDVYDFDSIVVSNANTSR